ncbi:MAG: hypothetical protein KKG78_10625, partial [Alphaproteobacteria bacterium]|nr:hypothetical protein [Alphaproteobacteria bacterium]
SRQIAIIVQDVKLFVWFEGLTAGRASHHLRQMARHHLAGSPAGFFPYPEYGLYLKYGARQP